MATATPADDSQWTAESVSINVFRSRLEEMIGRAELMRAFDRQTDRRLW